MNCSRLEVDLKKNLSSSLIIELVDWSLYSPINGWPRKGVASKINQVLRHHQLYLWIHSKDAVDLLFASEPGQQTYADHPSGHPSGV